MSTTTDVLSLFKYDPVADADSTFNITQALNNNWDKLDAAILLAIAAAGAYNPEELRGGRLLHVQGQAAQVQHRDPDRRDMDRGALDDHHRSRGDAGIKFAIVKQAQDVWKSKCYRLDRIKIQ